MFQTPARHVLFLPFVTWTHTGNSWNSRWRTKKPGARRRLLELYFLKDERYIPGAYIGGVNSGKSDARSLADGKIRRREQCVVIENTGWRQW
jgi:hypothetical protein